jgi:hypothetical protein
MANKRIPLIRRKNLINAGISDSHLAALTQRNEYFKNRTGDTSFFTPYDALLIFIASWLFDFLPFRNVSKVINKLIKSHRNLYGLLKQNSKQLLIIEKRGIKILPYEKVFNWSNHQVMVLINLEKIYFRVEKLFQKEGIIIAIEGED